MTRWAWKLHRRKSHYVTEADFADIIKTFTDYESRRTMIGSMRPAERAGRYDARTATVKIATPVNVKMAGSVGFTSFKTV